MVKDIETLSEDERRALRGSKFAPLPSLSRPSQSHQPRLAHPGGPLTTNKAAALAKFLERKLKEPNGLESINPDLLELAVNNAKQTVYATSSTSNPGRSIRHVDSFGDSNTEDAIEDEKNELSGVQECKKRKKKKKKEKKKIKKQKKVEDPGFSVVKKPKKKFKF
ncbi:nucleolar protein 58-like [Senna tora]|uniref:Nucleolar protein 58-like n=1 Tax=Senna tora TaxID=362788 RepID=A0A834W936_9FABA|nr:nucleolar protein 58-like [Senna tora]